MTERSTPQPAATVPPPFDGRSGGADGPAARAGALARTAAVEARAAYAVLAADRRSASESRRHGPTGPRLLIERRLALEAYNHLAQAAQLLADLNDLLKIESIDRIESIDVKAIVITKGLTVHMPGREQPYILSVGSVFVVSERTTAPLSDHFVSPSFAKQLVKEEHADWAGSPPAAPDPASGPEAASAGAGS